MVKDFDQKLNQLKKELKDHTEKQVNGLARIIADGFKNEREHFDKRLDRITYSLDNREQVVNHERRIKRVEQAVGLR